MYGDLEPRRIDAALQALACIDLAMAYRDEIERGHRTGRIRSVGDARAMTECLRRCQYAADMWGVVADAGVWGVQLAGVLA